MEYDPNFPPLPVGEEFVSIPEDILKAMSTDSAVSYRLCQSVKEGALPPDLQHVLPGRSHHA